MISILSGGRIAGRGGCTRRELLRAGGLTALGLSSTELTRLRALAGANSPAASHRRNSCVFIFLFGGPSHIDLWDMKPDAPAEIRGEFKPIATAVPGVSLCEHLPRLARSTDKLCLLRSMTHHMPVHGPACSEMYTGRPYFGPPITDQATPEDWPSLAAMVTRYGRKDTGSPPAVVLPAYSQFAGQDKPIAGQDGGRMGSVYRPFLVRGDPSEPGFQMAGLRLPEQVPLSRAEARRSLLRQVETELAQQSGDPSFRDHYATAFAMLSDPRTAEAFEVHREPPALRTSYGPTKFAQSLLLARRLVEAGVSLVTVNYDDETRNEKVSPFWDTHNHNFPALKDRLAPRFDQAFSAFVEDLHARGLLESTLVVVTGEFGRTPRVGQFVQNNMTEKTGRDHWPHAFTVLLAGGGVRGGQTYGATDRIGGHVQDRPVTPADLAATILHHLGVDATREYWDGFQRVSRRLCEGVTIHGLA